MAWKCAFRIPLTRASLTRLCKRSLKAPANIHPWWGLVGEQRGKSISWILDFIMIAKKQLCSGSFFNDPKVHTHESFSGRCLFDMGERIELKKRGESCSPEGFDKPWVESQIEHLNHGPIQSFRQLGHPDPDTNRPVGSRSHIWKSAEGKTTASGSRIGMCVKYWWLAIFYGCLRVAHHVQVYVNPVSANWTFSQNTTLANSLGL